MPSRKVWAHGNHYLKEEGPAYIRLQTKGDFLCSSISGEAPFGFDYKLTSGKVKNNIDFCIKNILCLIKDLQKNYHKNEDKTYRCCKADWILPVQGSRKFEELLGAKGKTDCDWSTTGSRSKCF